MGFHFHPEVGAIGDWRWRWNLNKTKCIP